MELFQSCAYGHQVSGLTWVDMNFFFVAFFLIFFWFHPCTLDCFIIELNSLTRMGLGQFLFNVVLFFIIN
jgi:hypothetical protein